MENQMKQFYTLVTLKLYILKVKVKKKEKIIYSKMYLKKIFKKKNI